VVAGATVVVGGGVVVGGRVVVVVGGGVVVVIGVMVAVGSGLIAKLTLKTTLMTAAAITGAVMIRLLTKVPSFISNLPKRLSAG
jgi:hypothetical protein